MNEKSQKNTKTKQFSPETLSALIFLTCGVLISGILSVSYYNYSYSRYETRSSTENQTILNFITAFVATYSEHRKTANAKDLSVPATFRAQALELFNNNISGHKKSADAMLKVRVIGLPGREIIRSTRDDHANEVMLALAAAGERNNWNGVIPTPQGPVFRTIKPVVATKDSCVSCHNKIQKSGPIWKKGETMGAYIMDTPAAEFFSNLYRNTIVLAVGVFLATIVFGGLLLKSFARYSKQKLDEQRQSERMGDLKSAREQAQEEANVLSDEVITINKALTKSNEELRQNFSKLRNANDQLLKKGKLEQLGQLTATVAHEIRNPLNTIRSSAFLLDRKFARHGSGMSKPLKRISAGVSRCDSIITELLDFARTKSLQVDRVDFDEWLIPILQEEITELPELVTLDFHPGLQGQKVEFDQSIMQRALINLLSNASEAMVGKKAFPLEFSPDKPTISVTTKLSSRGVELSVIDNGPGISAENLKKVMEPLFTTKNFGVGLGLPAIEKIFEQHGGGLEFRSKEGFGARFTGWFPLQQLQEETNAEAA